MLSYPHSSQNKHLLGATEYLDSFSVETFLALMKSDSETTDERAESSLSTCTTIPATQKVELNS